MTFLISNRKRSLDDKLLTTFNEPLITIEWKTHSKKHVINVIK
jgi:hypothetical protein